MKKIYVAGPYRAETVAGIDYNITMARRLAIEVWKLGAAAFCPHLNSGFMDGVVPDKNFLDGDMDFLRICDGMIVVPGYEKSKGTLAEIKLADSLKIPVFMDLYVLREWLEGSK